MSDEQDVYRSLPPELTAALRDPSVVLPGELELFDRGRYWAAAPALTPSAAPIAALVRNQAERQAWLGSEGPRSLTGATVSAG